ncbi:MAG: hypothetical protein J1F20_03475, partial [Muribaculaceae bacterium]|nr:hypothetical protein [Muribaculaceae bacterium]
MKKFLLGTVALASMFFATSCGDEVQLNAGKENSASFTVTLDKVISSRAVGEGKQVNYLVYNVYEGDTKLYDTNKELTTFDGSATVEIENLESTKNYTIVFWAQNNTHEAYDVSDLTAVEIDYEEMTANDDKFDAFYGAFEFKAGQEGVEAKLKRPFAQINVGYKETAEGESAFKGQESSLMVAGIANTINLKTGVVGDEDELAEFTANDILTETLTAKGETYTYVSMAYVLVSKTGTNVEITFDVESLDIDAALDEVPVKCNYRTNLLGTYEAKSPTTASFDVSVDAGWDGYEEDQYFDQDGDQDDPTQQITVSDVKADVQEENVVFSATYTGIAKDDIQSAKFVCTPVASPSGVKARAAEGVVEVTANTQEEGKLTASEPLTNFEAGKSYTYTVVITPTDGEAFTSEPQGSTDDPGFTVPEEEE